jgi:hypothetical protein
MEYSKKTQEYLYALGVDSIISSFAVNWTKIGNMQQSAGILLTVLSLIMTICFGFISSNNFNQQYHEKIIIFVILGFSLIFLLAAFILLFKIIFPKRISGELSGFNELNEKISDHLSRQNDEEDSVLITNRAYIDVFDEINQNLRKVLERNQKAYSYGVGNAICSFIGIFCFIVYLLIAKFVLDKVSSLFMFCFFFVYMVVLLVAVIRLLIYNTEVILCEQK